MINNDDVFVYKKVHIKRIYDADTAWFNFDLGLNQWRMNQGIRFYGINAPEMRGDERPKGLISTQYLIDKMAPFMAADIPVTVHTIKDRTGGRGRLLGVIFLPGESISLNKQLVDEGLAVINYYGGKERPDLLER